MKKVMIGFALLMALAVAAPAQTSPVQGGGLLHLPAATDSGAQKAGQLLEQMVQALGGEAYLNLRHIQQTGRTYSFHHGESTGTGALYWRFWEWPDKERIELTKKRDWIIIYDGDNGYEVTFRGVSSVEAAGMQDYLRRRQHSLPWVLRKWLHEPGIALLYEGRGMAERKEADKVTVLNAKNDAVTISIDTHTHLPLQVSFIWRDPKTRDLNEDAEGYDNYRPVQGIMTPFSVTRYHNKEISNQRFITETTYNPSSAGLLFDAKAAAAEVKKK